MRGEIPVLGPAGPAQSDELVHFTDRGREPSHDVPPRIRNMSPSQRLDAILADAMIKGFAPYGVDRRCVCLSESPPEHLAHLITVRGFAPWGIVATRGQTLRNGGGAVAYVPEDVYTRFKASGLGHWAVRTGTDSEWMHEREWRLPLADGIEGVTLTSPKAILIGDPGWRPSLIGSGTWINMEDGTPCSPGGDPFCQEVMELPLVWQRSEIWVWNKPTQSVLRYPPGMLC